MRTYHILRLPVLGRLWAFVMIGGGIIFFGNETGRAMEILELQSRFVKVSFCSDARGGERARSHAKERARETDRQTERESERENVSRGGGKRETESE